MSSFQIHQATRERVKALIGFYSKSGAGKTHSALLMMRGLVGLKGKIGVIDTESGRASIFADVIPGGFSVVDLDPPFTAERYWDALEVIQQSCDGIVIDSFSHCWSGEGGLLDQHEAELKRMAGDDWKKREQVKMTAWVRPKIAHKRLVERILRLKHPLIVCMRGEEKTHIDKDDKGKTEVWTDKHCSPIGDPRFIFELLIHAECIARENAEGHTIGGYLRLTKVSRNEIIPLLPGPDEQVGIKHGEALAAWCAGSPAKSVTAAITQKEPPVGNSTSKAAVLKRQLWEMTGQFHFGSKSKLEQWLHDELFIMDMESLQSLSETRLATVIEAINHKLTTK